MSVNKLWRGFWEKLGILFLGTALVARGDARPAPERRAAAPRPRRERPPLRPGRLRRPDPGRGAARDGAMHPGVQQHGRRTSNPCWRRCAGARRRTASSRCRSSSRATRSSLRPGRHRDLLDRGATRLYGHTRGRRDGRPLRELDLWDSGRAASASGGDFRPRSRRAPRPTPVSSSKCRWWPRRSATRPGGRWVSSRSSATSAR